MATPPKNQDDHWLKCLVHARHEFKLDRAQFGRVLLDGTVFNRYKRPGVTTGKYSLPCKATN